MPAINWALDADSASTVAELNKAATAFINAGKAADQQDAAMKALQSDMRTMIEVFKLAVKTVGDVISSQKAQSESTRQGIEEAKKQAEATREANKAAGEAARAAKTQAEATTKQAEAAHKAAMAQAAHAKESILAARAGNAVLGVTNLNTRALENLDKISKQYAGILKETGTRQSYLMSMWKQGLSPAEKTAAKLAEIVSRTTEAERKTKAYASAVTELTKRYEDQIRRQDTNVGSQHKLSRSLSELLDQQRAAITVGSIFQTTLQTTILGALRNVESSLGKVTAKFVSFGEDGSLSLTGLGSKALLVGAGIAGMVTGVALAGKAIVGMALDAYKTIDALDDMSARIGVSTQDLSQYRYIMDQTDVSQQDMAIGLKFLSKSLVEAQDPTSKQGKLFQALGFDVESAAFKSMSAKDAIVRLSGVFSGMTSETEKISRATEIFGRSGNELLPILSMNTQEMQNAFNKNKQFRLEIEGPALKAARDYEKASKDLGSAITGLKESSIVALPWITSLVNAVTAKIAPGSVPLETRIKDLQRAIAAKGTSEHSVKVAEQLRQELEELLRARSRDQNAVIAATNAAKEAGAQAEKNLAKMKQEASEKERLTEAMKREKEATNAIIRAQKTAEKSAEDNARSVDALRSSVQNLVEAGMDPWQLAQKKAADSESLLSSAMMRGAANLDDYAIAMKAVNAELLKAAQVRNGLKDPEKYNLSSGLPAKDPKAAKESTGGIMDSLKSVISVGSSAFGILDSISQQATGMSIMDLFMGTGDEKGKGRGTGKFLVESMVDGLKTGLPAMIPVVLDAVVGGLSAIADTLAPALPGIIGGLLDAILTAMPDLIRALVGAGRALIVGVIEMLPTIIQQLVGMLPILAIQLMTEVVKNLPMITIALVKALPEIAEALLKGIFGAVIGMVAEVLDAIGLNSAADKLRGVAEDLTSVAYAGGGTQPTTSSGSASNAATGGGINQTYKGAYQVDYSLSDGYLPAAPYARTVAVAPGDTVKATQAGGSGDSLPWLKQLVLEARAGNELHRRELSLLERIARVGARSRSAPASTVPASNPGRG